MPLQISDSTTTVKNLDNLQQKLIDIPKQNLMLLEPNKGRITAVGHYNTTSDYSLTVFITVIFLIFTFTLSRAGNIFANSLKDLGSEKKSRSFVSEQSYATTRSRLLLMLSSFVIEGFVFSLVLKNQDILHFNTYSPWIIGLAISLTYYVYQIVTNNILSYIYVHKNRKGNITKSINNIYIIKSLLYFFISILTIYTDIPIDFTLYYCLAILIISKLLLICRCIKLFFSGIYQIIYVVLYLCALEIAPLYILYKVLLQI